MDEQKLAQIKDLMEQGKSSRKIALQVGVSSGHVRKIMQKLRIDDVPNSHKKRVIQDLINKGATPVEVARATHSPINSTQVWIDKITGEHVSVDKQLKLEFSKGTSLSKLRNRFGVQDEKEAISLIHEIFDDCQVIIYTKELNNGDKVFVIIPDSTSQFAWMSQAEDKKFKYYVSPENNYMFVELPEEFEEITIFNLTDLHIGSTHCREDLLVEHIKMIESNPNFYALIGGDVFDYLHKNSVGQPWEQYLAPMEQVSHSARLLMPIANKTIRYMGGNHDRGRGYKLVGADLAEMLANLLKVSYGHMETTIDILFKGNLFTMVYHHGGGRGGSIDNILRDASRFRSQSAYFVHWHLSGHVHNALVKPYGVIDREIGKGLVTRRWWLVVGGSYEARTGSYAEEAKMAPTPQDLTYVTIKSDGGYSAGSIPIDSI